MVRFYCCVPLCTNSPEHNWPLYEFPAGQSNRFDIWLARIGRIDLFMKPKELVRTSYRVCGTHFSKKQRCNFLKNKFSANLREHALPDVRLPYKPCIALPTSVYRDHDYTAMILDRGQLHKSYKNTKIRDIDLSIELRDHELPPIETTHHCLFCITELDETIAVDIQLNDTRQGSIVENFLRTTLLYIKFEQKLESNYICIDCLHLVNEFEKCYNKCNTIQDRLLIQYAEQKKIKDPPKYANYKDIPNVTNGKHHRLKPAYPVICDNKQFCTVSTQTNNADNEPMQIVRGSILRNYLNDFSKEITHFDENNENINIENIQNVEAESNEPFSSGDNLIYNAGKIESLPNGDMKAANMKTIKKTYYKKQPVSSTGYSCTHCGKVYWKYQSFKRHEFMHKNKDRFRCEVCNKTFALKSVFSRHTITHTDKWPHKCETCGKQFRDMNALRNHNLSLHPLITDRNGHCCEKCGQLFSSHYAFHMHMKKHRNENRFVCELCDKKFTEASHLRRHLWIHLGIRPYKCDICGKSYRVKEQLKTHLNAHNGIRNFQCDTCGKAFLTKTNMQNHMNIHLAVKPFPCPLCERRFAFKQSMKSHMKIHFKEKKGRKEKNKFN